MKVIPLKDVFTRTSVEQDANYLYLFTDNYKRSSGGGHVSNSSLYAELYGSGLRYPSKTQAVIRGLSNAFPIVTMLDQYMHQWKDIYLPTFKKVMDFDIESIKTHLPFYDGIKYAAFMPFGRGTISNMDVSSPKCFAYLNKKLLEIGIDNSF